MKTSNFSKFSKLPKEDKDKYIAVAISNTVPNWFTDDYLIYEKLNPHKEDWFSYKNRDISDEEFIKRYTNQLEELNDKYEVLNYLYEIEKYYKYNDKEVVLLCWCGKDKVCHRHILRDYFNRHSYLLPYDMEVEEL